MKPGLLLKIAAGCTLFFAVGHSIGHFTRKEDQSAEALDVYRAMEGYKFALGGSRRSFDEFYEGMSLNLIITLLGITAVLWILSNFVSEAPALVRSLSWPLLFIMVAFAVTSFMFFFVVPAVTCVVCAILILLAIFNIKQQA